MRLKIDRERLGALPQAQREQAEEAVRNIEQARVTNPLLFYEPHPKQKAFHSFTAQKRGFFGGTQSGKTTAGLADDIIQAVDEDCLPEHLRAYKRYKPPFLCRIMAESFPVLETTLIQKLQDLLPVDQLCGGTWKTAYDKNLKVLQFENGSKFFFMCFGAQERAEMPDGTHVPVKDLKIGDFVQTRHGPRRVNKTVCYENAPRLRIRARGGFEIVSTPNHPHMTTNGWRRSDEIEIGDQLVTQEPIHVEDGWCLEPWEVGWLAILIGDGCLKGKTPFFSALVDSPLLQELPPLPPGVHIREQTNGEKVPSFFLSSSAKGNAPNPVKELVKALGLWGKGSHEKFIPALLFRQSDEVRSRFLRYLWSCDGTVNIKQRSATYATASRQLAVEVKLLLRTIGLYATITEVKNKAGGFAPRDHVTYAVSLSGSQFGSFNAKVGKIGVEVEVEAEDGTAKHTRGTVFSIEELEPGDVYCVEVDEVHELIVDGIVTSNTYEQEVRKMGGASIDRVHFDEEPPLAVYNECKFRVTAKGGDLLFTMTPIFGITWTYSALWQKRGEEVSKNVFRGEDFECCTVDISENPAMSPKDVALALEDLSEEEKAARKEGRFVALHGLIYAEYGERHKIPERPLPKNINVVVGIDPGIRNRTAVAWAYLTPDDKMVVFKEGYYENMTVGQVCEEIHKANADYEIAPLYYVIDPAARNKAHQTGRSDQMEYADHGIVTIAGQNSVTAGINKIKERLQTERLFIMEGCVHLDNEMKMYRWKQPPKSGEDSRQQPVKRDDHLVDALRYLVMSRPYLPSEEQHKDETELQRMMRLDQEAFTQTREVNVGQFAGIR